MSRNKEIMTVRDKRWKVIRRDKKRYENIGRYKKK
jgi:hypothetical protein